MDVAPERSLEREDSSWIFLLAGRLGITVAFLWGFAEGSFFPIVPDLIITLAALFFPGKSVRHILAVVAGGMLAGCCLYIWASFSPASPVCVINKVPFVTDGMFRSVGEDYATFGGMAMLKGPLSGIPYKVYAVLAPPVIPLSTFLLLSIPARLERLVVSWAVFACVGRLFRRVVRRKPIWGLIGHSIYWTVIYAYYWCSLWGK